MNFQIKPIVSTRVKTEWVWKLTASNDPQEVQKRVATWNLTRNCFTYLSGKYNIPAFFRDSEQLSFSLRHGLSSRQWLRAYMLVLLLQFIRFSYYFFSGYYKSGKNTKYRLKSFLEKLSSPSKTNFLAIYILFNQFEIKAQLVCWCNVWKGKQYPWRLRFTVN